MSGSTLLRHAKKAFAEFESRTAKYRYTTDGLQARPDLLEHASTYLLSAPIAFNDESYFALIRNGTGRYVAAHELGVDPLLIKRRLQVDYEFLDRVVIAEAMSLETTFQRIREGAERGEKWAVLKLLESKNPNEFGQQEKPAANIQINIGKDAQGNDPILNEIRSLEADIRQQQTAKQLAPPVIDVEVVDDGNERS